jgi:coenzyme F420-0:L-glutamate ligase/coenzyme F420-1:gamma-L-glutamate ligase
MRCIVKNVDISLLALPDVPLVAPGDDLIAVITAALQRASLALAAHDVVVVASKIVAKSEGCLIPIADIEPSPEAERLARLTEKDPRLVELVLRESLAVSRAAPGVLIVRHRLGFVSANAGIDFSNVGSDDELALVLPDAPDKSAVALRTGLQESTGAEPLGVVIADTHGRAFRRGNLGVAIGVAGVTPLLDQRGTHDLFGRELRATIVPLADQLAAAAGLVGGEGAEGIPVVIVRGLRLDGAAGSASELVWSPEEDLFA